jgi:Pyridoxamine 5'-phosphate oxidase
VGCLASSGIFVKSGGVKQRDKVAMTPGEVADFLAGHHKMQLATINRDGTPHLVTMFYTVLEGRIAFWTYQKSQKALNLARDPRVTCLVEGGDDYFELRGVQVNGVVQPTGDVLGVGRAIARDVSGVPEGSLEEYVAHTGRKRLAYLVEPRKVSSWDHAKLLLP